MSSVSAFAYAQQDFVRSIVIEGMGLFWLLAELAILCAVVTGREYLEAVGQQGVFPWKPRLRQRTRTWGLAFLGFALLVFGRHVFLRPVHVLIVQGATSSEALYSTFIQRSHEHLAVWALFITLWVLLEALIVYHGWRGYGRLRELVKAREQDGCGST